MRPEKIRGSYRAKQQTYDQNQEVSGHGLVAAGEGETSAGEGEAPGCEPWLEISAFMIAATALVNASIC